jgi:hypothetical protein
LTPTTSSDSSPSTDVGKLFFTAFDADEPADAPVESVLLPLDDRPITFWVHGNQLDLSVKNAQATLKRCTRVRNIAQLNARRDLVRRIRLTDEAIGQSLERMVKVRNMWRARGTPPDSFELHDYTTLYQTYAKYSEEFGTACRSLHQIWSLDPETGNKYHSWTLPVDNEGATAIFLPDTRPGAEDQYIEARFWFGRATMPSVLDMPAADVTIVPDCLAPYRPFNVPALWCDEDATCVALFNNSSCEVIN